jgi:hypothetical protein
MREKTASDITTRMLRQQVLVLGMLLLMSSAYTTATGKQ